MFHLKLYICRPSANIELSIHHNSVAPITYQIIFILRQAYFLSDKTTLLFSSLQIFFNCHKVNAKYLILHSSQIIFENPPFQNEFPQLSIRSIFYYPLE